MQAAATLGDLAVLAEGSPPGPPIQVPAQIAELRPGKTQGNKPFFDIVLADATHQIRLKIWSDSPAFVFCETAKPGDFVQISGRFYRNQYGVNAESPHFDLLADAGVELLLAGSEQRRAKLEGDWELIHQTVAAFRDPRLRLVAQLSLEQLEKKWRRAAAARGFHHARRGGLVEHTAQMMRCALALAPLYPEVSSDLLCSGVLFHDAGKLWENDYPDEGFVSPVNRTGELLGHIVIGIELANRHWREAREKDPDVFEDPALPPSDLVRDHLLHLIAAHHGSREFGSPVTPRTPEAWLLHHIDNIDAKIEMLRCTYLEKPEIAPGLYDIRRPLEGHAAKPLTFWNLGQ
jgi:3'-5' exoribonuclease